MQAAAQLAGDVLDGIVEEHKRRMAPWTRCRQEKKKGDKEQGRAEGEEEEPLDVWLRGVEAVAALVRQLRPPLEQVCALVTRFVHETELHTLSLPHQLYLVWRGASGGRKAGWLEGECVSVYVPVCLALLLCMSGCLLLRSGYCWGKQ